MTLQLKNFVSIKNTIYLLLIFNITVNAVTVKTKVKHKITPKLEIKKQLNPQEIDPNISPNPVPVNDDTVVVANDPPTIENHNNNSNIVENNNDITASEQTPPLNHDDTPPLQKLCECSDTECNCCRDFIIPIVPVKGPGCARIRYIGDQKMSVSIKYGDITLASRVISGKKAKPICVPLPGGFSSFCGRIYGLTKERNDFKACLGLELRAEDEIEAALRVSCFKFGSKGLQLSEAEPLPPPEIEKDEDDYDFFGLGGSDDDDDDDADTDNAGGQSEEADYDGFSLLGGDLLEGIFGGGSSRRRNL